MKTYILIDRSGSMGPHWTEMTGAMKAFAEKIKGKLYAAVFDTSNTIEYTVVHNDKAKKWDAEASMKANPPRGGTPLYDAIGRLNAVISKKLPAKTQIVILTDGYENASMEFNADAVKKIIENWEKLGYDVVYLGASFTDALKQAQAMGLKASKVANMSTADSYVGTMSAMATRNMSYAAGQTLADDDLGEEVRTEAEGKKKDKDAAKRAI